MAPAPGQTLPEKHAKSCWHQCQRCRVAYDRAKAHTLTRLRQARFPAKMIMGWLLLADGRQPKELKAVVNDAMRWKQSAGADRPHNHRRNWYPALAGILLAEVAKFQPDAKVKNALQGVVDHFVKVQERTGGWYKWFEGAYNDRPDYPVKDLGMLDAIVLGFLHEVRSQGVNVPGETLAKAEACVAKLLGGRGISYGTGSRSGDPTGARGAFAMNGLLYARQSGHSIVKTYTRLLPRCIGKLDQGHHVGGLHALGVVLGCHLLGPGEYKKLTTRWLDEYIDKQQPDGGVYIGDDGDAGGEKGLLGEDDASTAAFALMILLQDPSRLRPWKRPQIDWLTIDLPRPSTEALLKPVKLAARGKLDKALAGVDAVLARRQSLDAAAIQDAESVKRRLEDHALSRLEEGRAALDVRDVLQALDILEPLAKTLARHDVGTAAKALVQSVRSDPELRREHQAQKALWKAWETAGKRGYAKAGKAFGSIVKRFGGTRAAKKAQEALDR